ncbi:hypothetical protein HDE_06925 [Halotydeus destructor]|nr:hypothetical protein HDE_06925 [Halotydeus destructor]
MQGQQICTHLSRVRVALGKPFWSAVYWFVSFTLYANGAYDFYWILNYYVYDMKMLRGFSVECFPLVAFTIMSLRSSKITDLMTAMSTLISPENGRTINKYVRAWLVFYLLCTTFYILGIQSMHENWNSFVAFRVVDKEDIKYYHWLIAVVGCSVECFLLDSWISITASIYLVILSMWSMADVNLSKHVLRATTLSRNEALYYCKCKKYSQQLKKQFESMFAIFPLLYFASIFTQSTGLIVSLSQDKYNIGLVKLAFSSINVAVALFLVIVVNRIESEEKERNQLIVDRSWDQICDKDFRVGLRLQEAFSQRTPLTAIFFELNLKVILSFAGSIISFTIMLLQLRTD